MIKYNVNDDTETRTICSKFPINKCHAYNFIIGNIYYGIINKQFTAFKVISIDFIAANYDNCVIKYNLELPNGKKITSSLDEEVVFFNRESVINYIRFNNKEGVMYSNSLTTLLSEELSNGIFAIEGNRYNESRYLIIPNLYYYDKDMRIHKYTETRFYFIRKDKNGIHYAAEDVTHFVDGREDEPLYTSYEEADKKKRILYDFDGEEEIKDIKLKEDEFYFLVNKEGEGIIFLKDGNNKKKTSYKCYCYDPETVGCDEEKYTKIYMSDNNGKYICDDDDIDFLEVANKYHKNILKNLLSEKIEKEEKDANFIAHFKKFL